MINMFKPISISLSPNTEKDDVYLALKLLFQCWKWKKELIETDSPQVQLEEAFKRYLGIEYAVSFNSGRSALMAILSSLEIEKDTEVLLQAFTCNAAVNPIIRAGLKPVYIDIDDTLNLNPEDLKRKITPYSRAVMVQHNFGWPAQMEEISKIARDNNLFLGDEDKSSSSTRVNTWVGDENKVSSSTRVNTWVIEDCAHSLGAKYKGKLCGTFGDASFFSFGRDKIISSIFGGMAVTNNEEVGKKLKEFQKKLDYPSNLWILQQLLHPILMKWKVMPLYATHSFLGRIVLGVLHQLSFLSKAVYRQEKKGEIPRQFPKKFPRALAILALNQFKKLNSFNVHRRIIADFYQKELKNFKLPLARSQERVESTFMRYPVLVEKETDEILKEARRRKIYLDDGWRKSVIIPPDTDIEKMKYISGSCPRAEKTVKSIVNLPTHINISEKEAKKVTEFLKAYGPR